MKKLALSILAVCSLLLPIKAGAQTDSIALARKTALLRRIIKLPGGSAAAPLPGPYQANWESIKANYQVPQWLKDGKFGI